MTKKEWQKYYQVSDEVMALIEKALKMYKGRITRMWDTRKEGKWGDGKHDSK